MAFIRPGIIIAVAAIAIGCRAPAAVAPLPSPGPTELPILSPVSGILTPTPPAATIPTPDSGTAPSAAGTPTPIYTGDLSAPCGVLLSPLPGIVATPASSPVGDAARASLRTAAPDAAWPALQRLLDGPQTVGLVAYQVGREGEGVYLNGDAPMPLASVAKLITLVAYAEAVAAGELNPLEQVPLAELDRYYLPNFDLSAHRRAIDELTQNAEIISPDDNPAVQLEDVAAIMIRYSSNAAADYLQFRLGQERIEQTAIDLGLNDGPGSHSAPCTFLGQFLMMANHTRGVVNDRAILAALADGDAADAQAYGREMGLLADAYINQPDFRTREQEWRSANRRPLSDTQRYFTARLAPQGTAGAYARLMQTLAQNGLSSADSSFQARRILEWPNLFPANQEFFSNVGYKNGSLPGVLTTAYYAYRWGDGAAVVVVLFFRDLPQQTYRQWRFDLPHDELARWLLTDPAAIPTLAAALRAAPVP
ncbi:MAG: serine hydrolase [Candidatus Promineofilum sp.]|nr:serine hydrolase [Promineifilum sp.]